MVLNRFVFLATLTHLFDQVDDSEWATVKLYHWAYLMVFNRFAFLAILTPLFDKVEDLERTDLSNTVRHVDTIYKMQDAALQGRVFPSA